VISLLLYLLLALGISFLCSILEAALLSMPPSFVRQIERSGQSYGKRLDHLKRNVDQSLAAILTLNTIAHTIGAAGVGSQAVAVFGEAYFGLISAILTLLILFLSEIIPKTLGAQYWRSLAKFTTYSCHAIVIGTYPLVVITKRLTAFIQSKGGAEARVSRDEIIALAQIGRSEGVLAESESRMIRSLIRFRELRVEDIMTPRTVIGSLSEETPCKQAIADSSLARFTRIPLYQDSKDNITGYVLRIDLMQQIASGEPDTPAGKLKRPISAVSEFDTLPKLFDILHVNHEHIAIVIDEFGGTSGLVTQEDVIETLLGLEIVDESDADIDMRELARKRWEDRAKQMGIFPDGDSPSKKKPSG
jgi:CBS domain containing-hemolysin-like protein